MLSRAAAVLAAVALGGCFERTSSGGEGEPVDAGVPGCPYPRMVADEADARAQIEATLACEDAALTWQVACADPEEDWYYPPRAVGPQGADLVGHLVLPCRATADGQADRTFRPYLEERRLPPLAPELPGVRACLDIEGAPGERFNACLDGAVHTDSDAPPFPQLTTVDAVVELMETCYAESGCPREQVQIDCWGPARLPLPRRAFAGYLIIACRLETLAAERTILGRSLLFPFATY
ncbi:MAG: hypothetical protein KC549_09665 [Myxococcales bacterium]|nr:hypothetical protein [Myxococcales bacterium]MCB9548104.1 hypothetical protein [Myxococcales bacterium]